MEENTRALTRIPAPKRSAIAQIAATMIQESELEELSPCVEPCAMT
jgi:hypothetical protein